jgi:hypothetical protein
MHSSFAGHFCVLDPIMSPFCLFSYFGRVFAATLAFLSFQDSWLYRVIAILI